MVSGVPPALGGALRKMREGRGFSQRRLVREAAELGGKLSGGHVAEVENGNRGMGPEKIAIVARTLGLTEKEHQALLRAAGHEPRLDGATAGTLRRLEEMEARLTRIEQAVAKLAPRRQGGS